MTPEAILLIKAAMCKDPKLKLFFEQGFWHAHYVDIEWRIDGEDQRYEADWIKDIWNIIRREEEDRPHETVS